MGARMNPIIGVTASKERGSGFTYQKVNDCNLKALIEAGAVPVILPVTGEDELIHRYLEIVDGIYFSGGGDIDPLIFGENPIKEIKEIDYDRDEFEIKLFKKAVIKKIPMLGICRGAQIMNVAAGGTLYQDIYAQKEASLGHSPKYAYGGYGHHKVKIMNHSKLYDIFQSEEIVVNSYHHQAVREVAEGFKITAISEDGIIEGIESENLPFAVGIQWHPEIMYKRHPEFLKIFKVFVKAAIDQIK